MFMDRDEMSNFYNEPSVDASCQVSVQLAKQFQMIIFLEIDQSEQNCLWRACLLTDLDEISIIYRGPPIDGF